MKTGLLFTEVHEIVMDRYNSIKLNIDAEDNKVSALEAIYVRYKFEDYTQEEVRFIRSMMGKFNNSVHICDIDLSKPNAIEIFDNINEQTNKGVAIFGKIPVTDMDLIAKENGEFILDCLEGLNPNLLAKLDKVVIVDKSTKLNMQHFKAIELAMFKKYNIKGIGLCGSPFTCKTNCCISALFARELAAVYGNEKTAIAVASHENTDGCGCGCVRYQHINYDITQTDDVSTTKPKKQPTEKKDKKDKTVEKEPRVAKPKNAPLVDVWF